MDNGATWTSLGNVVSFNSGSSTSCPSFNRPAKIHNHITAQGNNIAVSFIKPNGSYCNVGIAYSTNGGSTWSNKYVAQTSTDQILPMVASSLPSNLYVMWQEKVGSQWAIKWEYSTNWTTKTSRGTITMDLFMMGEIYSQYRQTIITGTMLERYILVKGNLNELPRGVVKVIR
jgi:hypothetical protein